MRFVVDAQLPMALADRLEQLGHDAIHVKRLPRGGDTRDSEITRFADNEGRAVVTKDLDFRHMHETGGHPSRLLLITVGNVRNGVLLALISAHHDEIVRAFDQADFVELGTGTLTLHPKRDANE